MVKLILLSLLAGAFFSSTFILNELMSSTGGHWFWSASLRYVFMWLILTAIITTQYGFGRIKGLAIIFYQHWRFWCLTGSIGFGVFYTGICIAADHVAGWVVAATFMSIVVTSLLVLAAFGQRFDKKFIVYAVLVFAGVILVNLSEGLRAPTSAEIAATPMATVLLFGALPALIAAFSYPIGNQLVWQASFNTKKRNSELSSELSRTQKDHTDAYKTDDNHAQPLMNETLALVATVTDDTTLINHNSTSIDADESRPQSNPPSIMQNLISRIPAIETNLLHDAFNKVWLMTLGSLPFWLILGMIVRPESPSTSQVFNTLLVALLAGVAATSIFLYARERAETSSELAGVDSAQASEVIFALIGGIILLNNEIPSAMGFIGIGLIMLGLILFAKNG